MRLIGVKRGLNGIGKVLLRDFYGENFAFHLGDAAKFEPLLKRYAVFSCIGTKWIEGWMRGILELIPQKGLERGSGSLTLMGDVFWKDTPLEAANQEMSTKRGECAEELDQSLKWFNQAGAKLLLRCLCT